MSSDNPEDTGQDRSAELDSSVQMDESNDAQDESIEEVATTMDISETGTSELIFVFSRTTCSAERILKMCPSDLFRHSEKYFGKSRRFEKISAFSVRIQSEIGGILDQKCWQIGGILI